MKTKETIAIIGATINIGSLIARNLSKDTYRLILMSKDTEKLHALRKSLSSSDTRAIIDSNDCAKEVSWEADIIMIAHPYEPQTEIAEKIREVAIGKVVITMSNPLNANYSGPVASSSTGTAEELQKLLPNSTIVKAFNRTFAEDFSPPLIDGEGTDTFIAAHNGNSLDVVSNIVDAAGLIRGGRPVGEPKAGTPVVKAG